MDNSERRSNGWIMAIGVIFLMVAVGLAGFVAYKYVKEYEVDELVYDLWLP